MFTPFSVYGCSLELLQIGEKGIIIYCKIKDDIVLKKLKSLGVATGTIITLEQQFPSLIVKVGKILLDVEKEVARAIYVRILKN
ncbi:ferrous iron transport protein A [Nostocaceae cyanobacterium CENA357]|uniref:Ferrous iron transport protein A n=2 Tax=Atlanticothrix TaxID=2840441 RepID=A0A8J7KY39_9CYAN|nr:ferrous iron transport protein A [Atlanticothrix silvestris CENA357]